MKEKEYAKVMSQHSLELLNSYEYPPVKIYKEYPLLFSTDLIRFVAF